MTPPVSRNRLDDEVSPHLQDHAADPVNWQPWGAQAFEAARTRDVPVFLSIGYAACYWCRVMGTEQFDDEKVAAVINDNFVPVKVDCLERPDVDQIYQLVGQIAGMRGGWPLSVWLTHEQKPFRIGTYFPQTETDGVPRFLEVLREISEAWSDPTERADIEQRAEEWAEAVVSKLEPVPGGREFETAALLSAAQAAVRSADREYGGWGSGPKYPHTDRILLLSRAYRLTDRDIYRTVAIDTLDAMANNGLYDHLGGGFHRYVTERAWKSPLFEKRLCDNATLAQAYLAAYQITGEQRYATITRETLGFIERDLTRDGGGYFSMLGAHSESEPQDGLEAKLHRWTPAEVQDVIGENGEAGLFSTKSVDQRDAELFCERYGLADDTKSTGLTISESLETLANRHEMGISQVENALEETRKKLLSRREEQGELIRDEQILASWNGLAVSAFADAAIVLEQQYATPAIDTLEFLRDQLWDESSRTLQHRYKEGVTNVEGFLDDYAFLGRGAFDCYQATGEIEYLAFALDLARAIEHDFWDEKTGSLYFTTRNEKQLARPQLLTDHSPATSVAAAVELLVKLGPFTTDSNFTEIATRIVESYTSRIQSNPLQNVSLILAADTVTDDILDEAVVDEDPLAAWSGQTGNANCQPPLFVWQPTTESELDRYLDALGLDECPPVWIDSGENTA